MPEEQREQIKDYMTGKKLPDVIGGKGGNFVFHLSNISEKGVWIPRFARRKFPNRYYLSGDVGIAIFDRNRDYHSFRDMMGQNQPQVLLRNRRIMVPANSLFDEMQSAFVRKDYQVQRDEIAEGYVRFSLPLYFAFLSRAIDKGFVDAGYADI